MLLQNTCNGHTTGEGGGNSDLVAAVALEKRDGCHRSGRADAESQFAAGRRVQGQLTRRWQSQSQCLILIRGAGGGRRGR